MDNPTAISDANETREFYLPATFQFGRGPGRIERFLRRVLGRRDEVHVPDASSPAREFYLPGTPQVRRVKSR